MFNLISILDVSRQFFMNLFDLSIKAKIGKLKNSFPEKIVASCFFEPSTRTKLSFDVAIHRLGSKIIGFDNIHNISLSKKNETFADTICMINCYANCIIIRHSDVNSSRIASKFATIPVINAGNGYEEHPTQAISDLFTIYNKFKKIDGLHIAIAGDLKYGRAVHSFILSLSFFSEIKIYLVPSDKLYLPKYITNCLYKKNIDFSYYDTLNEILISVDVLYMSRLQKERFSKNEVHSVNHVVNKSILYKYAKKDLIVMHPLPRSLEICRSVDNTRYAWYFKQACNSVFVRQALLYNIFSN